jgi:hypothetical protein
MTRMPCASRLLLRSGAAELFRFVKIGPRLSIFALFKIYVSPVVVGIGITGIQPDRLGVVGDRLVVISLSE